MSETRTVACPRHGLQQETFVCQHLAVSLRTRKPIGFFWSATSTAKRPDAWCFECNERVKVTGGQWIGEAGANLGVKLICAGCYDDLRSLNLPKPPESGSTTEA